MDSDLTQIRASVDAVGRIDAVPSILEVVCRTTGMGFAAVARVTEDRWVTCAVRDEIAFGLISGSELTLETTICNEIRQHRHTVVIDHVAESAEYCDHHTPAMYGFQSYISVPIVLRSGDLFGTLCAIDPRPAQLDNPQIRGMFTLFAEMIAMHLDNLAELKLTEAKLLEEKKVAELREQFIAILSHDLRNPIGAVSMIAQMMRRMPFDEKTMRLVRILKDASYRMNGMIENVLDFAHARLGGGVKINCTANNELENILREVSDELSLIWPEQTIEIYFDLQKPVFCDGPKIARLLANLAGNALAYGVKDKPVIIRIASAETEFSLSVCNSGKQIPEATKVRLFQPFERGDVGLGQKGLGLGLFIASEIATAHKGAISVTSDDNETCFTFKMPA